MLVVSLVVYAVSFLLTRLLSRYRELCADRAGAYLTHEAAARWPRRCRRSPARWPPIPQQDLRAAERDERVLHRPGDQRRQRSSTLTSTHPSLEQRLEQLARIQAELGRPTS